MLRHLLARAFWALSPWTLVTEPAPRRPSVILGAPHTSNWDFVFMLAITWRLRMPLRWLGKHTLFTSWRGPLMRALGGIPVDRSAPGRVVEEVVARVHSGEVFGLVITPDGTRGAHTEWKSGFYRIARTTGLPVVLGYVDRTTMTTGLGPSLELTGDIGADMERIRAFYADKAGYHPAQRVEPRLREERGRTPQTAVDGGADADGAADADRATDPDGAADVDRGVDANRAADVDRTADAAGAAHADRSPAPGEGRDEGGTIR